MSFSLPAKGGLDVADWIAQGATKEEILGAIGDRRITQAISNQKVIPIRDNLKSLLSPEETAVQIVELLGQQLSSSKLQAAKIGLRSKTQIAEREFNDLWHQLETERELEEDRASNQAKVCKLLEIERYDFKLTGILDPVLASPMEQIAELIGSTGVAMLLTLLPAAATLCKVGTKLALIPATGFYALPILYTGICGESGSIKSPTQKAILKPLIKLQSEAEEKHKAQLQDWELECKRVKEAGEPAPPKPIVREYYTVDVTREAIAQIQAQQPDRGFLGWSDELSAVFGSQNAYRNGRGSDREALLSGRDGTGLKVNRASGKRISTPVSAYSITGGTQPDTLRKLMGDFNDGTGQWARFLWTWLPLKRSPFPRDMVGDSFNDLQTILYSLYQTIEDFPATTYRLSAQATATYADWYDKLDDLRYEEMNQALRSCFAKAKGNTGEIALLLHIVNAAMRGTAPSEEISNETMLAAIKVMQFCIGQVKLIHSMGEAEEGELSPVLAKIIELSDRKGAISAKDAKTGISILRRDKKATADKIRGLFAELIAMGIGSIQGEGSSATYSSKKQTELSAIDGTGSLATHKLETPVTVESDTFGEESATTITQTEPSESTSVAIEALSPPFAANSELISKYCTELEAASRMNGHSKEALTKLIEELRTLPDPVKQGVWKRLPRKLAARIQVEVIGKPLRKGGAA